MPANLPATTNVSYRSFARSTLAAFKPKQHARHFLYCYGKGPFICDICTEGRGGQKSQILRMKNSDRLREMQTQVRGANYLNIVSLIQTLLPRILYHTPAGTSPMTMLHFAQIYSGGFRGFDGGVGYNLRAYGTPYPRRYGLDNARYPVAIYWGPNDWLATPRDVRWLAERLPNVVLNK